MALIKKLSMRDQCYEAIKEKILRQEYQLGEYINIVGLTEELEVSNTPIREALAKLEADGLVTSMMNLKVKVISFTKTSFNDIAQTIYILVKGAYELCERENKVPTLLSLMEKSLEAQEKYLIEEDKYQFINELVNFDRSIFIALESPQLLSVFERLSSLLFLMYRTNHQKNNWEASRSLTEHRQIVNAIAGGNSPAVTDLLNDHYNQSI